MAIDETVHQHKYLLEESEMPTAWYNIVPDLPSPPPPALHPGTLEPAGPDDFAPLFPMDLILQEVSQDRYIDIPGAVLDVYRQWRPSPLFRAHRLEQALGTPARIYYKYEGVSPAGSHKPNTAVPQAYYNAKAGIRRLTTETGAGQWGTALAFACALFGLECEIWQVGASFDQKPYRRLMMEAFGGKVHRSPSELTAAGRAILAADPNSPGSLGIAISEAVEVAAPDPETALRARQRAQPRADAPDHHRRGGPAAAGQGRRVGARPARRLHRGRLQLRRPRLPVPAREAGRQDEPDHPGGGAGLVPVSDPGRVRLRLRRHGRHDPADEDAHAGARLHPRPDPRRGPALPRHGPAHLPHLRARASWRPSPSRRPSASGRPCSSCAPRGSCPRRSRPTPSPPPSARRSPARSPARRRSSSRPCAATATSTWPPTTPTSPAPMVDEAVSDERFAEGLATVPSVG